MLKTLPLLTLGAVALFAAGSCVTVEPEPKKGLTSVVRSGSLPMAVNGATKVAFHTRGRLMAVESIENAKSLERVMDEAILERFERAGFQVVAPQNAQILIAYAVGVTGQIDDKDLREMFGVSAGIDLVPGTERGGLVVALVNRATRNSRWRASGSGVRKDSKPPHAERNEKIRRAIDELFRDLPMVR